MKKIYSTLIIITLFMACNDYEIEDQGFNLQDLPGYVAFNASGTTVTLDDVDVTENDESVEFEVENPTGSLSDITVTYQFGGNAVFGTDFTVTGASASGGTVVLIADDKDVNTLIHGDIEVQILEDGVADGAKTLTIELVSAVNESGETFAVGRGGLDILKTATINITDVDCGFAKGTYDVLGVILVDDFGSGPYSATEDIVAANCPDESQYNVSDLTGGLYTNSYATNYGTSGVAAVINIDSGTGLVTWSDVSDQFGGEVIQDSAQPDSNYNSGTGVITIYWTATAFGERGITTYTLQ